MDFANQLVLTDYECYKPVSVNRLAEVSVFLNRLVDVRWFSRWIIAYRLVTMLNRLRKLITSTQNTNHNLNPLTP